MNALNEAFRDLMLNECIKIGVRIRTEHDIAQMKR